jgi:RNA polymerase sigma factor (sigma-70 family)
MAATAVPLRSRRAARRRSLLRVGDERLVARVRAGDDDAFEAIYDRYYRSLLAFCRHMLGSRDAAEDALQHSFASAYTALRGGDGVIDLRPWLYAIARNRCLSALRAQRDEVPADEVDLRPRALDGLAGEIQMRADLRDLVDDLQRLPDDQRAALVLFELGDQSHEQIAQVLGVRREKVKALVFQAREALLRARRARDEPCAEVRERLATLTGDVPRRSMLRGHIDRCPGCAAFEREVRGQRAAFAAIMPVAPTVGLKASVLAILGGGGGAAAVGGGGGATVAGSVAAGGTTVGLASLGAKGVVTKVMAVVALAGGGSQAAQVATDKAPPPRAPGKQRAAHPAAASGAAVTLRAPARKFAGTPVAHLRGAHKHSSHSAAQHAPAVAPASASPTTTPAPAPAATHAPAPASEAPAATPQPSQQQAPAVTSTTTTAPPTSTETPQAPAASGAPAPTVAPAAPQDTAPTPPAAAPATVPPAAAPATVAPETTVATTTTSAPADAAPATTAAAATDAAP